jgi:hypothetical protein
MTPKQVFKWLAKKDYLTDNIDILFKEHQKNYSSLPVHKKTDNTLAPTNKRRRFSK